MKTSSSTQKGRGRLKRSESYDPSTQRMDELERDVYNTIATSTVIKNSQQKEKRRTSDKKQKQKKDGASLTEGGDVSLPPLTNTKQPTIIRHHGRPRSKSIGGEQEMGERGSGVVAGYSVRGGREHRVVGNRRSKEDGVGSKMKYTSHWDK